MLKNLGLCLLLTLAAGCQLVHKQDMTQGNILPEEKVAQLRPGLTMEQVHFLIGSPLLNNYLHKNRWDYVYYLKPAKGALQQKHLTLLFQENKVKEIIYD